MIGATHSPLVMASVEPFFDADKDAWFDLDLVADKTGKAHVELSKRPFTRLGDVSEWLTGPAFDLESGRSLEAEKALDEAARAMSDENFDGAQARELYTKLRGVLGDTDPFWISWHYVAEKKGWE